MAKPILLFPQTSPSPSQLQPLLACGRRVLLLEPPGLRTLGVVEADRPPGISVLSVPKAAPEEEASLLNALREWETWAQARQGSPEVANLKVGVEPPPRPETWRNVLREIRGYDPDKTNDSPKVLAPPPELILLLAHLKETRDREIDQALTAVEAGSKLMEKIIGLEEAGPNRADFRKPLYEGLSPSPEDDSRLGSHLAAWAGLCSRVEPPDAWPATLGPAAGLLLVERFNKRILGREAGLRSPAGVETLYDPEAFSDLPLAGETARLVLPSDLDRRPAKEISAILEDILERLYEEKWSKNLIRELGRAGAQVSSKGKGGAKISVIAFPGIGREGLIALMKREDPPGLPNKEMWPDAWPGGSCPLLVVW